MIAVMHGAGVPTIVLPHGNMMIQERKRLYGFQISGVHLFIIKCVKEKNLTQLAVSKQIRYNITT